MDKEIQAAVSGGLRYWAFDWYAPDSSLRVAWTLYKRSQFRSLINWCGLVGLDALGSLPFSNNQWQSNMHDWAEEMQQSNYQKVSVGDTNRPLLYILWDSNELKYHFDNDVGNVRKSICFLRDIVIGPTVGPPYIVLLIRTADAAMIRTVGADAISSYTSAFIDQEKGTYADLDKQTREFWNRMAGTGVPTVPIGMVGWDTRPRQERPVPWGNGKPNPNPVDYYALATPKELAAHLRAAVEFIQTRPSACPSKTLLIYSWDECDEGGGLTPTLGDPEGSLLRAIAPIIS
jgi:hypothetical protein